MRAFGAPEELVKESANKEKDFEVFEENCEALGVFIKLLTQWQVIQGAYVGLNYQSVEIILKRFNVKKKTETFDKIQIMEMAALKFLNKESK